MKTIILKLFKNIDEYMILSHSIFYSSLCKFRLLFNLKDIFKDYFYKDIYPNLEVNTTTDNTIKFNINDSPDGVLNIIQKILNPNNTYGIHITDFDKFHKY